MFRGYNAALMAIGDGAQDHPPAPHLGQHAKSLPPRRSRLRPAAMRRSLQGSLAQAGQVALPTPRLQPRQSSMRLTRSMPSVATAIAVIMIRSPPVGTTQRLLVVQWARLMASLFPVHRLWSPRLLHPSILTLYRLPLRLQRRMRTTALMQLAVQLSPQLHQGVHRCLLLCSVCLFCLFCLSLSLSLSLTYSPFLCCCTVNLLQVCSSPCGTHSKFLSYCFACVNSAPFLQPEANILVFVIPPGYTLRGVPCLI